MQEEHYTIRSRTNHSPRYLQTLDKFSSCKSPPIWISISVAPRSLTQPLRKWEKHARLKPTHPHSYLLRNYADGLIGLRTTCLCLRVLQKSSKLFTLSVSWQLMANLPVHRVHENGCEVLKMIPLLLVNSLCFFRENQPQKESTKSPVPSWDELNTWNS